MVILPWVEPLEARVWAEMIVVSAPWRNHAASMAQRREQVFVRTFLPHPLLEAFDQAVRHRLAECYVVPVNLAIFLPL